MATPTRPAFLLTGLVVLTTLATLAATPAPTTAPATAPATAGAVLRVGPTRAHPTIQSAVDAARTGDLVLVDPGSYPAFAVRGKGIAVVAASTSFTVTTSPAAPAILIQNIVYPDEVTVVGAHVDFNSGLHPAVYLQGNTGSVRLTQLDVSAVADLCAAAAKAAVVVETTRTFWFRDSTVSTGTVHKASAAIPTGPNDGVSGVSVADSDGVVQNCHFRGYDACGAYAGDGLRMAGNTSVWLVDDYAGSPQQSIFDGGSGGQFGGNALHYLGAKSGLTRITTCGRMRLTGGRGSTRDGGLLALNNDGGQPQPGVFRLPKPCTGAEVAQTSTDAPVAPPGGGVRLRVFTLQARAYFLFASTNAAYRRNLLGLDLGGRGMVDVASPFLTVVAQGVTTGGTATVLNLPVPNLPSLSGIQVTFQGLVGPVNGAGNALSFPSILVITG